MIPRAFLPTLDWFMLKQLHTLEPPPTPAVRFTPWDPVISPSGRSASPWHFPKIRHPGWPPRQISSLSSLQDTHQAWLRFQCSVVRSKNATLRVHWVQENPAPNSKALSGPSRGHWWRPWDLEHYQGRGHSSSPVHFYSAMWNQVHLKNPVVLFS